MEYQPKVFALQSVLLPKSTLTDFRSLNKAASAG
jgi:hypothetical protein